MQDDDAAPRFLPQGDAALVVEFGDRIDPAVNGRVHALAAALAAAPIAGVTELVPTFRSLCLHYDPLDLDFADLVAAVRGRLAGLPAMAPPGRRITIPVCYEGDLAPDLAEVAGRTGLAPDDVVRLHAGSAYRVFMLGFLPGFAYMGSLPETLRLPRRASPRVRVPAGSVAIAMEMTAIYPLQSPGGWHLIGSAPTTLFDIAADPPALLRPGDEVRFQPVGRAAFEALRAAWQDGSVRPGIDMAPQ
jgi:inhibitor of KinA